MRQFNPCLPIIISVKLRETQQNLSPLLSLSPQKTTIANLLQDHFTIYQSVSRQSFFASLPGSITAMGSQEGASSPGFFADHFFLGGNHDDNKSRGLRRNLMVVLTHVFSPLFLSSFLPNRRLTPQGFLSHERLTSNQQCR